MTGFRESAESILSRLEQLRAHDAPTHGGRVLSYVYDTGSQELDALAGAAIAAMQPVNGLDPTTFGSVAALERDLVGFVRELLHGDAQVVGSVTSGGTESCLLAVKTARDGWLAARGLEPGQARPRLVAPVTVHAAFRKAAAYFGLELDLAPVGPDGRPEAAELGRRMGEDVALVVVSAPSYPHAALDPVVEVAALAEAAGIPVHVDACIGGLVLPFWDAAGPEGAEPLPLWDFRVPGVTSVSADLHKYGYAPKGASVLLQRPRDRQRHQYFAVTDWPGYPVVNATLLGSKSGGPLAAAWAIVQALGPEGFAELAHRCRRATERLRATIAGIEGLRVVGEPVGPLFAVATDESVPEPARVDPHHWADAARELGWILQPQPGAPQPDGSRLPPTTHLTVTPVTDSVLDELGPALVRAADAVRGVPRADVSGLLAGLPPLEGPLDSDTALALLGGFGIGEGGGALPERMAPLVAAIEALPAPVAERLLTELLARLVEPRAG
ncbi:MAG: aspartate aminotransferase family protein [Actinomycetales bacterium]|nr:aspartate aminotransferase family protein [Actinomycetales bacterium]